MKKDSEFSQFKTTQYDNLKVAIRVRPPLPREMEEGIPFRSIAIVSKDNKSISLAEYLGAEIEEIERQKEWEEKPHLFQLHRFTFDQVFDLDSTQDVVYNIIAKPAVDSVLEGYNSTIFAYGQTGTGKTYTMEGFTYNNQDPKRGIIQRTIEDIFHFIESTSNENTKFIIRASYLQIYNESISDLLKPEKKNLQIREDKKKGIYVDMLSEWAVRSPIDLYSLLKRGGTFRATSSTYMNDVSSRSHAVFVITVEQMTKEIINGETHTQFKVGKLNLVDLAGSERIRITGATGQQLEESKKINKSLSCLGNVINALTDQKGRIHIPYRDSKLTRLLEDSLGGNCKTTMIAMVSPAHESFSESLSSLHFAKRAKKIKNRPIINEDVNNRALIRQYETELRNLRNELEEKNRMIESNELIMQLQEQKEQAEQDRNEAIRELEKASKSYLIEREEKLNLEKKIQMMNSQMITGGHKIEETPQFKSALKNQIKEYEIRLQEIEKERQQMEEDKAETEQFRTLLVKQRDIMNALTTKLNERDEVIAQLQEELDSFENQEEINESLQRRVNQLEALLIKNKIPLPEDVKLNRSNLRKNKIFNSQKTYLPYEAEINYKEKDNQPIILLSPDEKINELRNIISERDNKVHFLNMISQKFISTVSQDGQIDLNKFLKQMESSQELYQKIIQLQKEKEAYSQKVSEQNETISNMQGEMNNLGEQIESNEKKTESLENENYKLIEVYSKTMTEIEKIIKKTNEPKVKGDLFNLYQYLNQEWENIEMSKDGKLKVEVNASNVRIVNTNYTNQNNLWNKESVNKFLTNNSGNNNSNTNINISNHQFNISKQNPRLKDDKYINKFISSNK